MAWAGSVSVLTAFCRAGAGPADELAEQPVGKLDRVGERRVAHVGHEVVLGGVVEVEDALLVAGCGTAPRSAAGRCAAASMRYWPRTWLRPNANGTPVAAVPGAVERRRVDAAGCRACRPRGRIHGDACGSGRRRCRRAGRTTIVAVGPTTGCGPAEVRNSRADACLTGSVRVGVQEVVDDLARAGTRPRRDRRQLLASPEPDRLDGLRGRGRRHAGAAGHAAPRTAAGATAAGGALSHRRRRPRRPRPGRAAAASASACARRGAAG